MPPSVVRWRPYQALDSGSLTSAGHEDRSSEDWPVRWIHEDGLHLTLKFFGEVPVERLEVIAEALRFAVPGTGPLALSLGEKGVALARPGPVEGLEKAAVEAFRAVPASLAAGRVLARLDPDMRGADPTDVDEGAVLSASSVFRAVALTVLALV